MEYEYDGYGNTTLPRSLGITAFGGSVVGGVAQVYRGQRDDARSTKILSGTTTQGWNGWRVTGAAGQFAGGFEALRTSPKK